MRLAGQPLRNLPAIINNPQEELKMAKWTDEDIKLMREQFNTLGGREMHRLMPHHSREAIVEYATSTLGIRKRSRSSQARSRHPAPTPKSQFPTDYKPSTIPAESIAAKAEALKAKYGTYNDGRRDRRRGPRY